MKMLARAALLPPVLFACLLPAPSFAQVTLPQVKNAASQYVPSQASVSTDQNGAAKDNSGAKVAGTLSAAGTSASIQIRGDFNFSLWGTFAGTCELDRSFDSGTTWLPLTALGTKITWSGPTSDTLSEPEYGAVYRVSCTSVSSGTVNYRVSQ